MRTAIVFSLWTFLELLGIAVTAPCAEEVDAADHAAPATLETLRASLSNHVGQARFQHAAWGIHVVDLNSGATIFSHDSDKLLKPASNAKLFTAAAVLDRFGPDHKIFTSIYAKGAPDLDGNVRGDVILYGRGDPSLAARFHEGNCAAALELFADAFERAGVRRIEGDLIGDDTYFAGPPFGAGWTWDDLIYYYGAEVSALTLEDNVVDLTLFPGPNLESPTIIQASPFTTYLTFRNQTRTSTTNSFRLIDIYRPPAATDVFVRGRLPLDGAAWTDAVTVPNPPLWFAVQLAEALSRRGITTTGQTRAHRWLDAPGTITNGCIELARVASQPLSVILEKMLKPSQNLYAQLLFLQLGLREPGGTAHPEERTRELDETAEAAAQTGLKSFLRNAEINPAEVLLEEGSGLSRSALVTPRAIVRLLQHMDRHRSNETYRNSLPLAGVDGTLRGRMIGSAAEKNVRAKTGSLRYVSALSGYVTTRRGQRWAFSVMLNNYTGRADDARADIDQVAIMLADFNGAGALDLSH